MRIRMNDRRERQFDRLVEATGESTKSKAIDRAIDHYIRQHNRLCAVDQWDADVQLTPAQIAMIETEHLSIPMFSERKV